MKLTLLISPHLYEFSSLQLNENMKQLRNRNWAWNNLSWYDKVYSSEFEFEEIRRIRGIKIALQCRDQYLRHFHLFLQQAHLQY